MVVRLEGHNKMRFSDYLKLVLGIFFGLVAVGVPMYLVLLLSEVSETIEMILLLILLVAWVLLVPWKLPIEELIGDFVEKYLSD